ncbi:MAG: hypothetical protein EOO07_31585 [Chitinophagaceae bacterium]|nr:MAG: hypothetical protein EOO07_31585 [Chitinophagaceae bacterium]
MQSSAIFPLFYLPPVSYFTAIKKQNFSFLIETTKDGLKLTSKGGTAWKELSFSINNDKTQAIDQYAGRN